MEIGEERLRQGLVEPLEEVEVGDCEVEDAEAHEDVDGQSHREERREEQQLVQVDHYPEHIRDHPAKSKRAHNTLCPMRTAMKPRVRDPPVTKATRLMALAMRVGKCSCLGTSTRPLLK